MGVTFPGSFCPDGNPHYWTGVDVLYSGALFRCKHCHKHLWLPIDYEGATEMGNAIRKLGSDGYCIYLDMRSNRQAKILMAKLQKLERLSAHITDTGEMARIAAKILDQEDYDRR